MDSCHQSCGNWIPSSPWKAAIIPTCLISKYKEIHPCEEEDGLKRHFSVLVDYNNSSSSGLPLYHLVYTKIPSKSVTVISILRSTRITVLAVFCDRCRLQCQTIIPLFRGHLTRHNETLIRRTLRVVICHPLWNHLQFDYLGSKIINMKEGKAMKIYVAAQENAGMIFSDNLRATYFNSLEDLVQHVSTLKESINNWDRCGNTVLHIAIALKNLKMVQCLICMRADVNKLNRWCHSPLHLASQMKFNLTSLNSRTPKREHEPAIENILKALILAGAVRCSKEVIGCTDDCMALDRKSNVFAPRRYPHVCPIIPTEDEISQRDLNEKCIQQISKKLETLIEKKKTSNVISALSLDGGGIKGLALIELLLAIEKRLEKPLIKYFDWVAGTSTGSIIAAAMGQNISLLEIQRLYLRLKDRAFRQGFPPYSSNVLTYFFKETFGENTTLADIKYPKMIFTSLKTDVAPPVFVKQRTYKLPRNFKKDESGIEPQTYLNGQHNRNHRYDLENEEPEDVLLCTAIRRSTAAPIYYKPCDGHVDGGIGCNNPTQRLLAETDLWNRLAEQMKSDCKIIRGFVLSLGCGTPPSHGREDTSPLYVFTQLLPAVIDGITATDGHHVDDCRERCHAQGIPFFRLTAKLSENYDLATKNNEKVIQLMWDAFVYAQTHWQAFDKIADLLKQIGTNEKREELLKWPRQ